MCVYACTCCKNTIVLCLWILPVLPHQTLDFKDKNTGYCVVSPVSIQPWSPDLGLFSAQRGAHCMLVPGCLNVLLQEYCSKSIILDVENLHLKRLFPSTLGTTIKIRKKPVNCLLPLLLWLRWWQFFCCYMNINCQFKHFHPELIQLINYVIFV